MQSGSSTKIEKDDEDTVQQLDESLKHRLLGPSLTKAGQDQVDQIKVSEIIYEASKGSKFFNNEQVRDKVLTEKIEQILYRRDQLLKTDLSYYVRKADEYITALETERDLSQVIVHVDCDAFYAAVEELDRPELKSIPFAVGKGVLTTCNYEARKFGCRSGMAGFVAQKLCPHLTFVPSNFGKYREKAEEVRKIIRKYDERFESASVDEAYINLTMYCDESSMDPWDAVQQLRKEIQEECKITVSAGIAANTKLAKIASNQRKPNDQFRIAHNGLEIMNFMKNLPVRKVNGVGRVWERELEAIGVKTCGDIFEHRGILNQLFGEKAFQFLINTYLGIGRTTVAPAEETERKSVGKETTFREMQGLEALQEKLRHLTMELEADLKRTEFKGRTLVLKVKLHTYEVITRQTVPPFAVYRAADIERFAWPMLVKLEKEYTPMRLRLMGLRCTSLVSTSKVNVNFFGRTSKGEDTLKPKIDNDGWEVWPETEFEDAVEQERLEDLQEMEQLSQEYEAVVLAQNKQMIQAKESFRKGIPTWKCPVCGKAQQADDKMLNEHLDQCLSRNAIEELVKEQRGSTQSTCTKNNNDSQQITNKKRQRQVSVGENGNRKTKLKPFFS